MKIVFIISNLGEGRGGHYHSLDHISRELSKIHNCKIVSIGSGSSPVLFNNPFFYRNIELKRKNFFSFLNEYKEIIQNESPDIIHFFDVFAYNVLRFALNSKKQKICITKCGGPNPKLFPYIANIVLFSVENYKWFNRRKKYSKSNIKFIPNRVGALRINHNLNPIEKVNDDFNFVRVCRISETYAKSIEDSINLIDYLRENGYFHVKLFIIGQIVSSDIYNQLKTKIEGKIEYIHLVTSSELTKEASQMLYLADAVLGTGRGVMEASSLKIPLLTFNSKDTFPILIDSLNFNDLFMTNFSERGTSESFNKQDNLLKIRKMIDNKDYYKELSYFSEAIFNKYFSINIVNDLYNSFYNKALMVRKKSFFDIIYSLRHIFIFIKKSRV